MAKRFEGYSEFQARVLDLGTANLIMQGKSGRLISFNIADTHQTAFPRHLYENCQAIFVVEPFKGEFKSPLPEGSALYGEYLGAGPFVSCINYISEPVTGFKVENRDLKCE